MIKRLQLMQEGFFFKLREEIQRSDPRGIAIKASSVPSTASFQISLLFVTKTIGTELVVGEFQW
jgi:hypothetical protein